MEVLWTLYNLNYKYIVSHIFFLTWDPVKEIFRFDCNIFATYTIILWEYSPSIYWIFLEAKSMGIVLIFCGNIVLVINGNFLRKNLRELSLFSVGIVLIFCGNSPYFLWE